MILRIMPTQVLHCIINFFILFNEIKNAYSAHQLFYIFHISNSQKKNAQNGNFFSLLFFFNQNGLNNLLYIFYFICIYITI
jgi:hypothetical protein